MKVIRNRFGTIIQAFGWQAEVYPAGYRRPWFEHNRALRWTTVGALGWGISFARIGDADLPF